MDLQDLLSFLEIDAPIEFEYFENFADLVECEESIPESTLFSLFSETDKKIVGEIIVNYFDDMLETLPDDSNDIYTLLEKIKLSVYQADFLFPDVSAKQWNLAPNIVRFKFWKAPHY